MPEGQFVAPPAVNTVINNQHTPINTQTIQTQKNVNDVIQKNNSSRDEFVFLNLLVLHLASTWKQAELPEQGVP